MIRAVLLAAAVTACTANTDTGITASDLTCPPDSTLTYANFGQAFLADNCSSCHTSRDRPSLTTQAAVQSNRAAIIDVAVTSNVMPASGSMTLDERKLLGEWLTCGAP